MAKLPTLASRAFYARSLLSGDVSAREVGERAGVGETHVRQIERGVIKNPRFDTLKKIAKALGVDPVWLLTGQGETPRRTEAA